MPTTVAIDFSQIAEYQEDGPAPNGKVTVAPLRRFVGDDTVLINMEYNPLVVDGLASVTLPTEITTYWTFWERFSGAAPTEHTFVIPVGGTINYHELEEIDPDTLDPELPADPAWLASLAAEASARVAGDAALAAVDVAMVADIAALHRVVTPNNATDQTAALQAALDAFAAAAVTPVGVGTWRIDSTLTIAANVDLGNATLNYHGTGVAVQVGAGVSGAATTGLSVVLPKLTDATKPTNGWSAGTVGVKVINVVASDITIPSVVGFETGLYLYADGYGNQHNVVTARWLNNNKVNFDVYQNATGWNNQNTFHLQRCSHNSNEGTPVVGTAHIRLRDDAGGNAAPNGNLFLNPSLESPGVVEFAVDVQGGVSNLFVHPRFEFTGGNGKIRWGALAANNTIIATNTESENLEETFVTGASRNVRIGQGSNRFVVTGDTKGGVLIEAQSSSAHPALTVMDAGATVLGASPVSAYAWRVTAQGIYGKRDTDAFERIRFDPSNGRVYFGLGTAAPTVYLGAGSATQMRFTGAVGFGADDTYDFGATTSTRPRNVYVATKVFTPELRISGGGTPTDGKVWTSTGTNGDGQWEDLPAGAGTNLTTTAAPSTVTINSDTGTDAAIAAADGSNAGVFLPAEKTKLTALPTAATYTSDLAAKAPLASPAFTGTPTGITATHVGLGNVTNTSDANKPVSTAQQTALDLKANAANPVFTGTVTIPDNALAIADTSGLQAALDAKATAPTAWVALTGYAAKFTPLTGAAPSIRLNNGMAEVTGTFDVSPTGILATDVLSATLAAQYRPGATRRFISPPNGGTVGVVTTVTAAGDFTIAVANASTVKVELEQIRWRV